MAELSHRRQVWQAQVGKLRSIILRHIATMVNQLVLRNNPRRQTNADNLTIEIRNRCLLCEIRERNKAIFTAYTVEQRARTKGTSISAR